MTSWQHYANRKKRTKSKTIELWCWYVKDSQQHGKPKFLISDDLLQDAIAISKLATIYNQKVI